MFGTLIRQPNRLRTLAAGCHQHGGDGCVCNCARCRNRVRPGTVIELLLVAGVVEECRHLIGGGGKEMDTAHFRGPKRVGSWPVRDDRKEESIASLALHAGCGYCCTASSALRSW